MKKLKVGIVDYGVGNHHSIYYSLKNLGLRCFVSDDHALLKACDILILPGVGAFRPAMMALESKKLDQFLLDAGSREKPIIGICLGMHLLGQSSTENGMTSGLGFIPGVVTRLDTGGWHIGWNTTKLRQHDPICEVVQNQHFYFNHGYAFNSLDEFVVCSTKFGNTNFASVVRSNNVLGVQFHPEKSQLAGYLLLNSMIEGLCNA